MAKFIIRTDKGDVDPLQKAAEGAGKGLMSIGGAIENFGRKVKGDPLNPTKKKVKVTMTPEQYAEWVKQHQEE